MFISTRQFITALGGYRAVATRLRVSATTMHGYLAENARLPSKWYAALVDLAAELGEAAPPRNLFAFEELPPALPVQPDCKDAA